MVVNWCFMLANLWLLLLIGGHYGSKDPQIIGYTNIATPGI